MPTFVVGDVHGHREALVGLLRGAGLLGRRERWSGRDARLWLLGDLVDRGPDGIGTVELVMQLASEGQVRCLLGNHEAMLLAAHRLADEPCGGFGATFRSLWEANGGQATDLARLRPHHVDWLERLPALAREGDWLLLHADTERYLEYGEAVEQVCAAASATLAGGNPGAVDALLGVLCERFGLHDPAAVDRLLRAFGGARIVHGHTPVGILSGLPSTDVTGPFAYGGGRVLDVDHCLYAGGPGFVVELGPVAGAEAGTKSSAPEP